MTIKYHDFEQGTPEWLQARCGIITASEMKLILTTTLKVADNDKSRAHYYELAAQRISQYVEPSYIGDDMLRGHVDEVTARIKYAETYGDVDECGFITNDKWGFTLGYSPDGLVSFDGAIEIKSRRQKYQIETITTQQVPTEHVMQLQTGLMVSEREWIDYVSYNGGLPMAVIRVYPDESIQTAIIDAVTKAEAKITAIVDKYHSVLKSDARLIETERQIYEEITA